MVSIFPSRFYPILNHALEFCGKIDVASPKFMFEVVKDKDGEKKFKVWAEQYSQRLELPTLFSNYEDGREKLAKRVLNWMRKRS